MDTQDISQIIHFAMVDDDDAGWHKRRDKRMTVTEARCIRLVDTAPSWLCISLQRPGWLQVARVRRTTMRWQGYYMISQGCACNARDRNDSETCMIERVIECDRINAEMK